MSEGQRHESVKEARQPRTAEGAVASTATREMKQMNDQLGGRSTTPGGCKSWELSECASSSESAGRERMQQTERDANARLSCRSCQAVRLLDQLAHCGLSERCSPANSPEGVPHIVTSPPPTLRPLQPALSNSMSFLIPAGGASARLASQRGALPACQFCATVSCCKAFSATGTARH